MFYIYGVSETLERDADAFRGGCGTQRKGTEQGGA